MYIKRHITNILSEDLRGFSSILLTGPRQVGKSTVLKEDFSGIRYVTLDDRLVLQALKEDPSGFLKMYGSPLILDEIQRAPDSFIDIKLMIDEKKEKGMYILTGSQKYHLMKNISESLAGRISIMEMLGLSLREINGDDFNRPFFPDDGYYEARKTFTHYEPNELWDMIRKGSMPEVYANDMLDPQRYYASYVNSYIERDVRELSQVGDTVAFTQFMTALAARTGELLNMHSIASDVGVDDKTVKRWISILEASGIIYLLRPFSQNAGRRIVKTPKVYFTDTGLVCYLCRWLTTETLMNGANAGNIFETFVFGEILKSYYNAGIKPDIYFFRTTNGQEIDFVFYRDGVLYPLEVKKTFSPNVKDIKHFSVLGKHFPTLKVGKGGVICSYDSLMPLDGNNMVIPVGML